MSKRRVAMSPEIGACLHVETPFVECVGGHSSLLGLTDPREPQTPKYERLHALWRVHSDQVESAGDHRLGGRHEAEPEGLLVALEHAVVVVEAVELVGHANRVG